MKHNRLKTAIGTEQPNADMTVQSEKTQKTILFLGASAQQLAPIKYALQEGFRVITCDNRPQNPGHRQAHASYNTSTTDLQAVCNVATSEKVDAVIAYGTDVGAPTAAWVAERLGLNGNNYNAVLTLTNKGLFRKFQKERGYFTPRFLILNKDTLRDDTDIQQDRIINELGFPLIIKPVDASGSKGINRVHTREQLSRALATAAGYSRSGDIIVEELVTYAGYQICGEGFLHDGKIIFHAFADEHFVPGISPPVGESFPCSAGEEQVQQGVTELQKIFTELGMQKGPFNFDLVYLASGEVFVIEIGPRNGGNRMPEAIAHAYGVDMIAATVLSALGNNITLEKQWTRHCATYSVHSKQPGIFQSVEYDPKLAPHIINEQMFVRSGETVGRFIQGADMLGCLILSFDSYSQMISIMREMDQLVRIQVDHQEAD